MSDDTAHAPLPPSGAPIWVPCPGAPRLWADTKPLEAEAIGHMDEGPEGTAVHSFVALGILQSMRSLAGPNVGDLSENDIPATQEMLDCAEFMVHDVVTTARSVGVSPGPRFAVEQRVNCKTIHPDCWGTPDCWLFDQNSWTLYVWDYKHGHSPVVAYENWQLIAYAAGVVSELSIKTTERLNVVFRIVAPRCFDGEGIIREWSVSGVELSGYFDRLRESARIATSDGAFCVTGGHCRHCRARHNCTTFATAAAAAMDYASDAMPQDLTTLGAETELLMLYRAKELIDRRIDATEARIKSDAMRGAIFANLDVRPGTGRKTWKDPSAVIALGDFQRVDLRQPPKPITPGQAIKAGLSESLVDALTHRPDTGLKIKPVDKDRLFARKKHD